MCSAIAATGVPALVMAKGHQIGRINEVPFVVSDKVQTFQKTKEAVVFLRRTKVGLLIIDIRVIKKKTSLPQTISTW